MKAFAIRINSQSGSADWIVQQTYPLPRPTSVACSSELPECYIAILEGASGNRALWTLNAGMSMAAFPPPPPLPFEADSAVPSNENLTGPLRWR